MTQLDFIEEELSVINPEKDGGTAHAPDDGRKSAEALRTIGEVAHELGLPPHVLRFWESKFPQIKPLKRSGGRRFYRPADVRLIRYIKRLLHEEGYTIKGAEKALREGMSRTAAPVNEVDEKRELQDLLQSLKSLKELLAPTG